MSTLFDAPEAEAARQLFYLMAGESDRETVAAAWRDAELGIPQRLIASAVDEAIVTRERMATEDESVRFAVYNIQRQFIGFLERIGLREEAVPGGRGEVAFYNLAKFSQAISDFEAIHFHSRPVQKYESFAGFLRHQAESAYGKSTGQDERFISPDAVQILTIHRAKGLQWPVVFVPQLVRNRFPQARRGGRTMWHLIPDRCVAGQARVHQRARGRAAAVLRGCYTQPEASSYDDRFVTREYASRPPVRPLARRAGVTLCQA